MDLKKQVKTLCDSDCHNDGDKMLAEGNFLTKERPSTNLLGADGLSSRRHALDTHAQRLL
jgi:hypothetical protein